MCIVVWQHLALCPQCLEFSSDWWIAFYIRAYLCLVPGYSPSDLPVSFSPALLSTQTPPGPVQSEEKLLPPTTVQQDTEAEKQMIREVRPRQATDVKDRVSQGEPVPVGCHPASLSQAWLHGAGFISEEAGAQRLFPKL